MNLSHVSLVKKKVCLQDSDFRAHNSEKKSYLCCIPAHLCSQMKEETLHKLRILTESAKYDVSCSSSGTVRSNKKGGVGNTVGGVGICHRVSEDGRGIALWKVMLTKHCMYDGAYGINRRSNE